MISAVAAGKILLLHGASSAGKSTLAAAIQATHPMPLWHWSIDKLRDGGVLPTARISDGAFHWNDLRAPFFEGFLASIEAFADAGNHLIVEHIFEDHEMRDRVLARLTRFDPFLVGIHTPLETLLSREAHRGDREIGSAARDFAQVHDGVPYHFEVDGTHLPTQNAQSVIAAWTRHVSDSS